MGDRSVTLGAEFPGSTRERWLELVEGVLRGAPFSRLVTTTYDPIEIQPLYTADDERGSAGLPGQAPFVRGSRPAGTLGGWDVRQRHGVADAAATAEAVLDDLERGVTSIWLRVGSHGVPVEELSRALDGVFLDMAAIALDGGTEAEHAAEALFALWHDRSIAPSLAGGNMGLDPFHDAGSLSYATSAAVRANREYPNVTALVVDGIALHRAGAADAHELAGATAMGVAWLRVLTDAGMDLGDAAGQIEFRFAATADQFTTIAKLRAARRLWARVGEVAGTSAVMRQHAVTSPVMMTRRDPWVNMLRTTVACFAAGVAGADAITVLPFDHAIGRPDQFSLRIARNTHALLVDESNVARVLDPGGGSWYIEALTESIANAAWSLFREIEGAGGYTSQAGAAVLDARIATARQQRERNIARRRDPITGVSEFPDITEEPVMRTPPGDDRFRYASMFEELRDRTDRAASRPRLFLATLGPVALHTARAAFAKNFFEVAGIEAVVGTGAADDTELVAAFAASGCSHAVLCSSDKVYEARAETSAQALRDAGASRIYLAGNPGDARERYRAAGIDEFIYVGCDVRAVLTEALATMGVE